MRMRNCKGSIFLFSLLFLLASQSDTFVAARRENLQPKFQQNCTYAITIETTCTKGADTSNHISLRFGDTKSNDVLVHHLNSKHTGRLDPLEPQPLDDVPRDPFQACTVDQFRVTGRCVESPVCYLYLKLSGSDDWRPGFAQVRVVEGTHLSSDYFYFRRFLPRGVWHGSDVCESEHTPFGIKYKRKMLGMKKFNVQLAPYEH